MNREPSDWDQLIVDDAASPLPLEDSVYRRWLSGQRVFVSSRMDADETPYRVAVRAYLEGMGGPQTPVMWETITPRDAGPVTAYLGGVDRSSLFVLMLAGRSGVREADGFTPTQKEDIRAVERRLHRMLFELPCAERDGWTKEWLSSLRHVLSGNKVASPDELVQRLDARLRELAAQARQSWIKLGRLVFPGSVEREAGPQTGERFVITARVSANPVRRGLADLGDRFSGGVLRLTYPDVSRLVVVERVGSRTDSNDEDAVVLTCRGSDDRDGNPGHINYAGCGPVEQATLWCRRAILGEPYQAGARGMLDMADTLSRPSGPSLPEVIKTTGATGWLAEGLARLYAVEGLAQRGGTWDYLAVGPATAKGLPIRGKFGLQGTWAPVDEMGDFDGFVDY